MCLAAPFRMDDDITNLDNTIMIQSVFEINDCWGEQFVGLALGMLVVETGKLLVIIHHAVLGGFHQPLALGVESLHLGMNGSIQTRNLLLARNAQEGDNYDKNERKCSKT